jgi:hypothetical protein
MRAAKRRARQTGRSLTRLLEDCLRAELKQAAPARNACEPLPTYMGNGVRAGVDHSDSSALEDLMNAG